MLRIPGIFIGGFLVMTITKFCTNMIYPYLADFLIDEVGCGMPFKT